MLQDSKLLLDLCTERFPSPRPGQSHSLTIKDGNLILTLMQGDVYLQFILNESDLDKTPDNLIVELIELVSEAVKERENAKTLKNTSDDIA